MMMMMIHIQRLYGNCQNCVIILYAISGRSVGNESSEEAAAAVRDLSGKFRDILPLATF
jgi:hypothetical protein